MSDFIAIFELLQSIDSKLDQLTQGETNIMSDLDDVTTRLETDEASNEAVVAELRTEISNLGSQGADVTRLSAIADKLESTDTAEPSTGGGGGTPVTPDPFVTKLSADETFDQYQARLFTYNAENPNNQVPAADFKTLDEWPNVPVG